MPTLRFRYESIPQPEDDYAVVRRCLRAFAKAEQQHGAIPSDVPDEEIFAVVEAQVPRFVAALRHSPLYSHLKSSGHTEDHIRTLIELNFGYR